MARIRGRAAATARATPVERRVKARSPGAAAPTRYHVGVRAEDPETGRPAAAATITSAGTPAAPAVEAVGAPAARARMDVKFRVTAISGHLHADDLPGTDRYPPADLGAVAPFHLAVGIQRAAAVPDDAHVRQVHPGGHGDVLLVRPT